MAYSIQQNKGEGSLSPLQRIFGDEGWRVEKALIDPEGVKKLRSYLESRLERLKSRFGEHVGATIASQQDYAFHQTKLPDYVEQGLPDDFRHFLAGEFDLETRLSGEVAELIANERSLSSLQELLDLQRFLLHYPPMVRFKYEDSPTNLVPVHQDRSYNKHLSDFITMWIPLTDINEEVGGVIVYEGSHLGPELEHTPSGAWENKAQVDVSIYKEKHPHMAAGDALFFPPMLLHKSAVQRSPEVRFSVDFRIFRNPTDTTKPFYCPFERKVTRNEKSRTGR